MPQLRFLSTLRKVCGGVSPLLVIITQMSVTARELRGWTTGARRSVIKMRCDVAELLLTLAQRPYGVAWITSQPWISLSFPSYITLEHTPIHCEGLRRNEKPDYIFKSKYLQIKACGKKRRST